MRRKVHPIIALTNILSSARITAWAALAFLVLTPTLAVPQASAQFSSYKTFRDSLTTLTSIADATDRNTRLTTFWDGLKANGRIPFAVGDSMAFLYRGSASGIQFAGDFNRWNPSGGIATQLAPSNVWIREHRFPDDARLDYKIVRNGSDWILDPENPLTQRGGFGDNSELRMPAYVPSPWVDRRPGWPSGNSSSNRTLVSTKLGYTVIYRVYTPPGYDSEQLADLPVIYVTDGHEYANDFLGSMRIVLDNLIGEQRIVPVMAVFIDPRVNGTNLRGSQYVENPAFADFVADELIPVIDGAYRTHATRWARAIMGTSLGGLNAAYFGARRTDAFYLLGIQSPAFQVASRIFDDYENESRRDLRIHMSWGTINDVAPVAERMNGILRAKNYQLETLILNESHSWGSWRATLDDMLEYFWGAGSDVGVADPALPSDTGFDQNYPNPFDGNTTIPYVVAAAGRVTLTVHDILGRRVATLVDAVRAPGEYEVSWDAGDLAIGAYMYRLESAGQPAGGKTLVVTR